MPSITEENGDSGSSSKQNNLEPILGTGLNIPSLEKSALISSESISVPTTKQHRAPVQKKAIARPSTNPNVNNNYNINNQSASSSNPSLTSFQTPAPAVVRSDVQDEKDHHHQIATKSSREEDPYGSFVSQVYDWLQHERARRRNARKMKASSTATTAATPTATTVTDGAGDEDDGAAPPLERTSSQSSDTSASLDRLESILLPHADKRYESGSGPKRISRRRPVRGLRSGSLSESDHPDIEAAAPSVETFLDNTKTLASSGGAADGEEDETSLGIKQANDKENWHIFKSDILRIVHTLRLKGWRRVPMDSAGDIDVVRLSGALTNAVYVVAPPPSYPPDSSIKSAENSSSTSAVSKRPPPKLLLRIYGPQVEHLIDREKELQILRRLGRKNIGPRVLGTFRNGRFEQYYEARPLTPNDLRIPDTYRQIAKRMRELHQGIELQPEEREGGPIVFKNWDKWVDRCEQVINWLDKEILSKHNEAKSQYEPWRRRGFVCGVPWPAFRKAVENYRKWLVANCGGFDEIKRQLVFAHNDTQYGNLLRLEPTGGSPLLTPANEHKQLIVIDFEYASANTPGFEFANHFSEWCYNYHDVEKPWAFDGKKYPVSEDQHRFISEYLKHKPGVSSASPFTTPSMSAMTGNTPRLAPLDLDEDSQQIPASHDTENTSEKYHEMDVQYFMRQTRLWRVFNSAQWVAWGIVQAKVPGMEEGIEAMAAGTETEAKNNGENDASTAATTSPLPSSTPDADADSVESDEFDYLAYSQDRAMFFWADLLALGLVKEDELPDKLVECAKPRALDY